MRLQCQALLSLLWVLLPGASVEQVAQFLGSRPGPLLEKESHAGRRALVANIAGPHGVHRSGPGAGFPANHDPIDSREVHGPEVFDQRLNGQPPDRGRAVSQVRDSRKRSPVFHGYTRPDMARWLVVFVSPLQPPAHQRATLSQDLVGMARRLLHDVENAMSEVVGDVFVEKVRHRVDKHSARLAPLARQRQPLWPELQVEALLVGVAGDTSPAFGEDMGIASIAARTDFGAARYRIPRGLGPRNCSLVGHGLSLSSMQAGYHG